MDMHSNAAVQNEVGEREKLKDKQMSKQKALERIQSREPTNQSKIVRTPCMVPCCCCCSCWSQRRFPLLSCRCELLLLVLCLHPLGIADGLLQKHAKVDRDVVSNEVQPALVSYGVVDPCFACITAGANTRVLILCFICRRCRRQTACSSTT